MAAAIVLAACASPVQADRATVLVFDASSSMWTRVEGDLSRIEVVVPMGQAAPADLEAPARADAARDDVAHRQPAAGAGQFPRTAEAADIILVTDGLETCAGDPCALAAELAEDGIDIRAHVVGFATAIMMQDSTKAEAAMAEHFETAISLLIRAGVT